VTIKPGARWGDPGPLAEGAPVVGDDAAAREVLQRRFEDPGETGLGEIGLVGGDLHRTLGSPRRDAEDLRAGRGVRYPVDVGVVELDGGPGQVFLSHLVAYPRRRLRWWSRRTVAVVNASYVGRLDLGPRAHPGDGRLDVTDGRLPLGQRRQGRRRALTGTHVPHPDLRTRSVSEVEVHAGDDGTLHVWLDGAHVGTASTIRVRCVPDAVVVVA
jgi:hypothetical protein